MRYLYGHSLKTAEGSVTSLDVSGVFGKTFFTLLYTRVMILIIPGVDPLYEDLRIQVRPREMFMFATRAAESATL